MHHQVENISGQLTVGDFFYPLVVFGCAFFLSLSLAFASWI